ncbi:MAG TPA: hypothetical protein VF546_08035 [Pyrinomonadaceae bacterium]|jgi:hypothetical protein
MNRKLLSLVLAWLLVYVGSAAPVAAQATASKAADKEARKVERIRASILKLGTGEEARVRLKLRDGAKLEGYVSEATADSFVVKDRKTGATTAVTYPQVKKIQGHNLSTGTKIAIGVGILAAVALILVLIVKNQDFDFTGIGRGL